MVTRREAADLGGRIVEESMQDIVRNLATTLKKWVALLAVVALAGMAGISAGQADQADAKRLLKAMSDYLAAQKAMRSIMM